jgi:hypothetical protein
MPAGTIGLCRIHCLSFTFSPKPVLPFPNLKIVVDGTSATPDVIWTGINSETVRAVPQFIEQGREHDELVKRDGRVWFTSLLIGLLICAQCIRQLLEHSVAIRPLWRIGANSRAEGAQQQSPM